MQEYSSKGSSVRHRGAIVATLAFLALGTVGFGAVGGFEMVRGWFITVEINGVPVDVDDANIHVEEHGDSVSITFDGADLDLPVEEGEATIMIVASPGSDAKAIIEGDDGDRMVVDLIVEDPDDDGDDGVEDEN